MKAKTKWFTLFCIYMWIQSNWSYKNSLSETVYLMCIIMIAGSMELNVFFFLIAWCDLVHIFHIQVKLQPLYTLYNHPIFWSHFQRIIFVNADGKLCDSLCSVRARVNQHQWLSCGWTFITSVFSLLPLQSVAVLSTEIQYMQILTSPVSLSHSNTDTPQRPIAALNQENPLFSLGPRIKK